MAPRRPQPLGGIAGLRGLGPAEDITGPAAGALQSAGLEAVRLIGGGCGFSAAPQGIGQTGNFCSSPAILKILGRKLQISDELLVIVVC